MDNIFYYNITILTISIIFTILEIISLWKVFEKAGQKSWKTLIPFYNTYTLTKIIFGNGWLFLLYFLPLVNAIFYIFSCYKLAKVFNKGALFSVGLIFLNPIFNIILGFGDAKYKYKN